MGQNNLVPFFSSLLQTYLGQFNLLHAEFLFNHFDKIIAGSPVAFIGLCESNMAASP